jgi:hypothetical protein
MRRQLITQRRDLKYSVIRGAIVRVIDDENAPLRRTINS